MEAYTNTTASCGNLQALTPKRARTYTRYSARRAAWMLFWYGECLGTSPTKEDAQATLAIMRADLKSCQHCNRPRA